MSGISRVSPFPLVFAAAACAVDLSGPAGGGNNLPPSADCTASITGLSFATHADSIEVGRGIAVVITIRASASPAGGCSFAAVVSSSDTAVARGSVDPSMMVGTWGSGSGQWRFELLVEGRATGTAVVRYVAGTRQDSLLVTVRPTTSRFVSLATGSLSCTVATDGMTYCWGGTAGVPVRRVRGHVFTALAPTAGGACGLDAEGAAYCWNPPFEGPTPVGAWRRFGVFANGGRHACGVTLDGLAVCWGSNDRGQLGDPSITLLQSTSVPHVVSGDRRWLSVGVGGEYSCGIAADSTVLCWGANDQGQLGASSGSCASGGSTVPCAIEPQPVGNNLHAWLITVGGSHSCTLSDAGQASCWGNNTNGQLGADDVGPSSGVRPVGGGQAFVSLSAGAAHTCGVRADGIAFCWGANGWGALGDGTTVNRSSPTPVAGGLRFREVHAGYDTTCGLADTGVAYCWGYNYAGGLGDGSFTSSSSPRRVSGQP